MMEEKLELKAALFKFAETFGHPDTEEEKNVTKEVYDRYLNLKRLIRKNSANVSFKRTFEKDSESASRHFWHKFS